MADFEDSDIPKSFLRDVDFSEPFDADEAYHVDDPADPDPTMGPRRTNLEQDVVQDGAVKATYEASPDGQFVYAKETSDYYISVQRLVWVDGWRKTTGSGADKKREDELTLVVLKLAFSTSSDNSKVGFAIADLRFQSEYKGGKPPEVVAWGPFRHREKWNESAAQERAARRAELRAAAGAYGQELGLTVASERETSWDRVDFDQGESHQVFARGSGTPHGVRWKLQQNKMHRQGITPELRLAVLISRPQPEEAYRVNFRLEAHTGTREQWRLGTQRFLCLPKGDKILWKATPRPGIKEGRCYDEGHHILESISTDNLGALITDPSDSLNLSQPWLRPWERFEVPRPAQEPEPEASSSGADAVVTVAAAAAEGKVHMQPQTVGAVDQSASASSPLRGPHPPVGAARPAAAVNSAADAAGGGWSAGGGSRVPGPAIGEPDPVTSTNAPDGVQYPMYARLVALEARAAQAEARLAAQEQLVFQLQQALAKADLTASIRG